VPSLAASSTPHVRIAENLEELLAAYRLVYRRYAERGLVRREPGGILYSSEFGEGDSRTLVAVNADGELNATATFVEGAADFSPEAIIPWRMLAEPDLNRRLAGVTCLAAASSAKGPSPVAFFALARYLFQYAKYRGFEGLVISIHPRQLRFYGRICPIVPLGPAYRQAKLGNALAVACRIDLDSESLSRIAPGVLSWFASPISPLELSRPGISAVDNAFLNQYARRKSHLPTASRVA